MIELTLFQLKLLTFIEKSGSIGVTKQDIGRKFCSRLDKWKYSSIRSPAAYVGGAYIKPSKEKGLVHQLTTKKGTPPRFVLSEHGQLALQHLRNEFCLCI